MKSSLALISFLSLHLLAFHATGQTAPEYLFHPETALLPPAGKTGDLQGSSEKSSASPSLRVAAYEVSFSDPLVLIDKEVSSAHFVSALWKGGSDMVPHQRNVLIVGSDYAVIVDYLYGGGDKEVTVERLFNFTFPSASLQPSIDSEGAGCLSSTSDDGTSFRFQSLTPTTVTLTPDSFGKGVTFSAQSKLPVPVTTIMLAGKGGKAPKVDYVKAVNPMVVKLKVTFADGRTDEVAMAWEARPLHLGKSEFNGWAAVLKHDPQGPGTPAGESSIEIK
jgi:hypothetical protein